MKRAALTAKWTPFERMNVFRDGKGNEFPIPDHMAVYVNSRYSVQLMAVAPAFPFGGIIWLSIKRLDRRAIHDWRDLQRIKRELLGAEVEAVELYPAESRLVDTSNQYHLWAFVEGYRLPFGYNDRRIAEHPETNPHAPLARQRLFEHGARPADCLDGSALTDLNERLVVPELGRELWLACWMVGAQEFHFTARELMSAEQRAALQAQIVKRGGDDGVDHSQ